MFLADNNPGKPTKVVVAVAHHISWATARTGPSKHVGGLMGTVDVVVVPAWYTTSHGPRPGPAHQIFIGWAAARPDPSKFQRTGRGPAQPITFSNFHGPARPITCSKVSARPGTALHNIQIDPARPGPDEKPMTSPGIY